MNSILSKIHTLRSAVATAELIVGSQETILAIQNKQVPKGDVFEMAKAAGLLGIKRTSDLIPDCHPLPIESASIRYAIDGLKLIITVDVSTIYKTGVEVEAMTGASIAALTIYDMLKPIDKSVHIGSIKLQEKKGGKSQFSDGLSEKISTAVIVCSDSISKGLKEDRAGKAIIEKLKNSPAEITKYSIIPDEIEEIQKATLQLHAQGCQLLLITGGTGLSPRDVTPEAVSPLLTRIIPGIMEAARVYGGQRTPYSMLSRGIAGCIDEMLVITLPGSTKGAEETMDALFPYVWHIFKVAKGAQHD
jgi:molybdenum cofactor biosynthesis protein MoaC